MRWGYSAGASWYAEEEAHTMLWCNEILRLCFAARGGRRSSRGNIWHVKETVLSFSPCIGKKTNQSQRSDDVDDVRRTRRPAPELRPTPNANPWVKLACVGIPHSDFVSSDQIGLMCVVESCWLYYRQENLNKLYHASVFFTFTFLHSHFYGCRRRAAASPESVFFFFSDKVLAWGMCLVDRYAARTLTEWHYGVRTRLFPGGIGHSAPQIYLKTSQMKHLHLDRLAKSTQRAFCMK